MAMTEQADVTKSEELGLIPAPGTAPVPHIKGDPVEVYTYRSSDGTAIYYTIKYDIDGIIRFSQRAWSSIKKAWVKKALPKPRPLYGMDRLAVSDTSPVLIVDNQTNAEAAIKLAGKWYVPMTWPCGPEAWRSGAWNVLSGRHVVLWPSSDQTSIDAMDGIVSLIPPSCSIAMIDPSDQSTVMDAAQALDDGMDAAAWAAWAKPLSRAIRTAEEVQASTERPEAPEGASDLKESIYARYRAMGIEFSEKGAPYKSILNARKCITGTPELCDGIWYDEFHDKIFTDWRTPRREWVDADRLRVAEFIQDDLQLQYDDKLMEKAVDLHAFQNRRNEPLDWLESLTWDGTNRIEGLFADYLGTVDNVYNVAASKNFMISMVARAAHPGCKVDNMIVLEGPQGSFKSTALEVIGGPWYTVMIESPNSKDFCQVMAGKLLIEFAELDTLGRADVNRIKALVVNRTDRYRKSYGRFAEDHPRQCVFGGSTNDDKYLRDATGGRRFWPIKCGLINLTNLKRDRTQLFAEAYTLMKGGATWWEMPEETVREQEERRQSDSWEEILRKWLNADSMYRPDGIVTMGEILDDCLKIEPSKQEPKHSYRVQRSMRVIGWESTVKWDGDSATHAFYKPGDAAE